MEYKHIHKEEIAEHDNGYVHKIISNQYRCQQTLDSDGYLSQLADIFNGITVNTPSISAIIAIVLENY